MDEHCREADFVFNLAGVNRPKDQAEFMEGNFGFASTLLDALKKHNNTCPIMISSSIGHSFPAVCIRTSTERPESLDKGGFVLAGIDEHSLLQAVDTAVTMVAEGDNGIPVPDYVEENVATKVVKLIQSYTGVVNKTLDLNDSVPLDIFMLCSKMNKKRIKNIRKR